MRLLRELCNLERPEITLPNSSAATDDHRQYPGKQFIAIPLSPINLVHTDYRSRHGKQCRATAH